MNFIARQLETYAESWKKDHLEATHCWRLEQALAVGLSLFDLMKEQYQAWRRRVASGEEEFSADEDKAMRKYLEWWLGPCDDIDRAITSFESKGYVVERAREFRDRCVEAKTILKDWIRPVRSMCPAYLDAVVTDEEAGKLKRMIDSGEMKIKGV